ncbi:MAG: diaminopimelate decarboxylase [Halanaerobiaceae bacterium]|nr:diaminopimelate decarboxylase [Halanaerobiaceae bacterium]
MEKFRISSDRAFELLDKYGSPLYVYSEEIIRRRCREMKGLLTYRNFRVHYSAKANTNLELLKIIREEGLDVDAMSPGELIIEEKAGFAPEQIFYVSNNISPEEMKFVIERGILLSVDSLSQLELYGRLNPGGRVAVRFNTGVGAGHHEKVNTGGEKTKFAIQAEAAPQVKEVLDRYGLKLAGINQHIGSLFLDVDSYITGARKLFQLAMEFPGLDFVDLGGGFGIPYHPLEERLDLVQLGRELEKVLQEFLAEYENPELTVMIEPGRYIVAEAGLLLGKCHAIKENYGTKYIGTDLGFNVLMRPVLYGSYHEVEVLKNPANGGKKGGLEKVNIVGNICESGDILAKNRELPLIEEGDVVAVLDVGAYGYVMASNYNCRLRPAEVLLDREGRDRLIRRRETLDDLLRHF